jgi:hypothetical protein
MFHVGARGVEMIIRWNVIPFFNGTGKKQVFPDSSLMNRNYIIETGYIPNRIFKRDIIAAICVGFIANHQTGPLIIAHGARSGIGKQIDEDIGGRNLEHVKSGLTKTFYSLFSGQKGYSFDGFRSVWFGHKFHDKSPYEYIKSAKTEIIGYLTAFSSRVGFIINTQPPNLLVIIENKAAKVKLLPNFKLKKMVIIQSNPPISNTTFRQPDIIKILL